MDVRAVSMATAVTLSMSLSACQEIVEGVFDIALDCIDDDRPVLSPGELPNPVLFQEYEEFIRVGIRNEPNDDSFLYTFTIQGALPEGIQTSASGRNLRLFGTPIIMGEFDFRVRVVVSDRTGSNDRPSGLCSTVDERNYQWSIQMM